MACTFKIHLNDGIIYIYMSMAYTFKIHLNDGIIYICLWLVHLKYI